MRPWTIAIVFVAQIALCAAFPLDSFSIRQWFFDWLNRQKQWNFVFSNDGPPANYIDPVSGQLVGQSVDLIQEVCRREMRQCNMLVAPRAQCWDDTVSPPLSSVLDSQSYEVCANLVESPDRKLNYLFPPQPIYKIPDPVLIARANSTLQLSDLQGTCNDNKLAFAQLTAANRDCMLSAGLFIKEENEVPVVAEGSITDAMLGVVNKVKSGEADVGLVIPRFFTPDPAVKILGEVKCLSTLIGLNVMVRKDATNFVNWWQPALKRFICSGQAYNDFCSDMLNKYNVDPLCFKPEDVDCTSLDTGLPPVPPPTITDPCAAK